jgi:HPt (histidine-containing phosphotransfer) domain-containing protein
MRSAHLLKGAAANLMCGPLRQAAMQLEEAARAAHGAASANNNVATPELQAAVQVAYTGLQQAAQNYVAFLQSIGI